MNFLAHLHLAMLANSSLLGNLLADFVRGNPAADYQPDVVAGIMMHRRVDVLTDSLPQVKASRDYFSAPYRRVAPITLDVVWDPFSGAPLAAAGAFARPAPVYPGSPQPDRTFSAAHAAALSEPERLPVAGTLAGTLRRIAVHCPGAAGHGQPPPAPRCAGRLVRRRRATLSSA